jgi:hypothetical protein
MMIGVIAAFACLIAALLLPETAGRRFSVIEAKRQDSNAVLPTPGSVGQTAPGGA